MENVWAFYRRSTDKQELSIDDQRRECQAFAARNNWQIVREFEPRQGYGSGLTIDRDESFLEMIRLAERGGHGIRFLVVYDVSRFGRLPAKLKIYYEQHFQRFGIRVVYAKDDFKNDGTIGDDITQMVKHSEAHQFSVILSELTLRGAKSHAALGHSAGGKAPYGYDRLLVDAVGNPVKRLGPKEHKADKMQRVVFAPNATERLTVNQIFETYVKGEGLNRIVADLNKRKVPSPRGQFWSKSMVHYMLRNRSYLGERIYNKRSYKGYRRGDKGSMFNAKDQWIIKENAHEGIVERELFEKVQARLPTRGISQGRSYHSPHLLTGLIVCNHCGYRFTGWSKTGNGHENRYYSCSGFLRIGESVCRSVHASAEELEHLAVEAIRERVKKTNWKDELKPTLKGLLKDQFGEANENKAEDMKKALEKTDHQLRNIVEAIKAGVSPTMLTEELTRLESQKIELLKDIAHLEGRKSLKKDLDTVLDELLGYADNFDDLWNQCATNEEKKAFLRAFIYQITLDHSADHIKATYYLYHLPQSPENGLARDTLSSISGGFLPKSIAGVGSAPARTIL